MKVLVATLLFSGHVIPFSPPPVTSRSKVAYFSSYYELHRQRISSLPNGSIEQQEEEESSYVSNTHNISLALLQDDSAIGSPASNPNRLYNLVPGHGEDGLELDKKILKTAIPSMINLAVVPLVNSVDTFWVGRMGIALAMAGQAAANQAFFTIFFLVNYLPTITAPMVASAVGSGDTKQARERVCESLFLSNLLGGIGMLLLVAFPMRFGLSLVLENGAPAAKYASPYLRFRALSMVPALVGATGFAAFRGSMDTVTPLKVSLFTNLFNLVLDPILIFATPLGVSGAAIATAASETLSGIIYLRLLIRRKLASLQQILRPPSFRSLAPLLLGGATMLGRQAALNVGFVCAARRAQALDKSGVAAAAYGIVMQLYSVGIVMHVAMQGTTAALVPAIRAESSDDDATRRVADRMFTWNTIVGLVLGLTQFLALPWLVPLFSTLPEVQTAVRMPALLSSLLLILDGPVFAGEGVMLGLGCFRDLMLITCAGIGCMVACLALPVARKSINGILVSFLAFTAVQALAVSFHYLKIGPLAVRTKTKKSVSLTS